MTAVTLLLIRHGETAWNAEHRIQGQLDVPLSGAGVWQAARLAQRLAREPIEAVVASDLARAWVTAEPLAQTLGLEPVADARLRERNFGTFQGHTLTEIEQRWPAEFAAWRERDAGWAMPGGESGNAFIARTLAALHDVVQQHPGRTVAVVAHGGILDVAYRHARSLSWDAPREHQMLNASINRVAANVGVAADGGFGGNGRPSSAVQLAIVGWGDVAHLDSSRDEVAAF